MKKVLTIALSAGIGFVLAVLILQPSPVAIGGGAQKCAARNGDVNADTRLDLSDAITILGHLFQGNPTSLFPLCASAGSSGLPATGQSACWNYDAEQGIFVEFPCGESVCTGQDGAVASGCAPGGRFVDNGDGTVTDTCTGLMWQKNTADVIDDGQIDPLGDALPWCEAVAYCQDLEFAGHNDWRLPNAVELQSIVDYGRRDPALHAAFTGLPQYYWSSTTYVETANDAWGIGFNSGGVYVRPKQGDLDFSFNFVRAVRTVDS
jgi:hypothetical protein